MRKIIRYLSLGWIWFYLIVSLNSVLFSVKDAQSQGITDKNLARINSALEQKDVSLADFLIAQYLGSSFKIEDAFNAHDRLVPFFKRHPSWSPKHFISGKYSKDFIDFFSRGSWSMWGAGSSNLEHRKILLEEGIDGDSVVVVWGTPTYSNWYVLTTPKPGLATVIGSTDTRIIFGRKQIKGNWEYCKRKTMNKEGSIQYIWKPEFVDLDNHGKKELLVRYNVMTADGYRQILDIYDLTTFCNPELTKTFEGVHGIATHVGDTIVVSSEISLDGKAILARDKQRFQFFRLNKGRFLKVEEFVENNFLWDSEWRTKVLAISEKRLGMIRRH